MESILDTGIKREKSAWRAALQKGMEVFRLTAESVWVSCVLGCIKHQLVKRGDFILLHSALMQPHIECCVQFWASQLKEHVKGT